MIPLFNKIYVKKLDVEQKEDIIGVDLVLVQCEVLAVGNEVKDIMKGDIIIIPHTEYRQIDNKTGYCTDINVLFKNTVVFGNKIQVKDLKENLLTPPTAVVVNSNVDEIKPTTDILVTNTLSGLDLPDGTTLISLSNVIGINT